MTITIELTPEVEAQLRAEAARQGLDAPEYIRNALEHLLRQKHRDTRQGLSKAEAQLLQRINRGLPPELWQEYQELIARRKAEMLAPDEQARLIALSDGIEEYNAERIESLAELARLRQTPLDALIQELGVPAPPYA